VFVFWFFVLVGEVSRNPVRVISTPQQRECLASRPLRERDPVGQDALHNLSATRAAAHTPRRIFDGGGVSPDGRGSGMS